jgi:hypothetical protein
MNFDEAIAAHAAWKQKLAVYLAKPDKSIDVAKLEKDDQCELGQWIVAGTAHFASEPAFLELRRKHAEFHHVAAAVVRRADAGEKVSEEVALGAKSAYADCSSDVILALINFEHGRLLGELIETHAPFRAVAREAQVANSETSEAPTPKEASAI